MKSNAVVFVVVLSIYFQAIPSQARDFHLKQALQQANAGNQVEGNQSEDQCRSDEIQDQVSINLLFLIFGSVDVAYYHWFDERAALRVRPTRHKWRYGAELDHQREKRELNIGAVVDLFDGDKEGLFALVEASYFDEEFTFVTGSHHESGLFPRIGLGYQWQMEDCYFFSLEAAGGIGPKKTVVSPDDVSATTGPTNYFALQWGLLF